MGGDQDWRLEAELEDGGERGPLDRLLAGLRGREDEAARDAQAAVGPEVVVTHDGRRLFAYAETEPALKEARTKIGDALRRDGLAAILRVSHWDEALDRWEQVDPPPSAEAARAEQGEERDAEQVVSQTVMLTAGKLITDSVERSMRQRASELGLTCDVVEHPHLLTTQIGFQLTGQRGAIEEFRRGLKAEAWATIRADGFGTGLV